MKPIVYEELKVGDEVVTRDGRKGRVICTDSKNPPYPIVCLIKSEIEEYADTSTSEYPQTFTSNGRYDSDGTESCTDIFLPSERVKLVLFKKKGTEPDEYLNWQIREATETPATFFINSYEIHSTIEVEI